MAKLGGRLPGTRNKPPLDRIKENQARLEKLLLDRALSGDSVAIEACLKRITEAEAAEKKTRGGKTGTPAPLPT